MCNTLYAMLNLFIIESVVCFVNGELEELEACRMELRYGHVVHRQIFSLDVCCGNGRQFSLLD